VSHSTLRRETSGLIPGIILSPEKKDFGSRPEFTLYSEGKRETSGLTPTLYLGPIRDFRSRPEFTPNPEEKTSYLPVVISPCSKRIPIPVRAVTYNDGYLGTPIPTIKHNNPNSYERIPTRKLCRYEDPSTVQSLSRVGDESAESETSQPSRIRLGPLRDESGSRVGRLNSEETDSAENRS